MSESARSFESSKADIFLHSSRKTESLQSLESSEILFEFLVYITKQLSLLHASSHFIKCDRNEKNMHSCATLLPWFSM